MNIPRHFTKHLKTPYDTIAFVPRISLRRDRSGNIIETIHLIGPEQWSQNAIDVLAQKYMRQTGVPRENETDTGRETDARQVFDRLANAWAHWGKTQGYFESDEDTKAFRDELQYMLAHQMAAPNSPQWFNTGLHLSYGIEGPAQGLWRHDLVTGRTEELPHAFVNNQSSACFIQSIEDSLINEGGIMDLYLREARLFKFGSGSGTNFSKLRGEDERLSGGGKSSGLMSFLKIGDTAAGAIKSGGTTRRAAKMVIVNIDHPDIEAFIDLKVKEEQKVAALVVGSQQCADHLSNIVDAIRVHGPESQEALSATQNAEANGVPRAYIDRTMTLAQQGHLDPAFPILNYQWEGEAYQTVTGQNANNSVRIPSRFLELVDTDGDWTLTARTTGLPLKTVKARALWNRLCVAAWKCADPGVQYLDTINAWHTTPAQGPINGSNPCSEYMSNDDTACNLASINLVKFLSPDGSIDIDGYRHAIRLWTIVLDITVTMSSYPSKTIAARTARLRQLGLGFANLGALLMRKGLPYDSAEARALTQGLTAILTGEAYATSIDLAKRLGPFEHFLENKEAMLHVIENHRAVVKNGTTLASYHNLTITPQPLDVRLCPSQLAQTAQEIWDHVLEEGRRHGFRNAQVTVIAPTGTIGLVMDCDTTGIEPDFALIKDKTLAGGGRLKLINRSVPEALRTLGYTQDQIQDIVHHVAGHGSLIGCPTISHDQLLRKGVSSSVLETLEQEAKRAISIHSLFTTHRLGRDWLVQTYNLTDADLNTPGINLLALMGFSETDIQQANLFVCGTSTIESAPHLKPEHLPVFDCANTCGATGTRYIAANGHLLMLGAVQPLISGGISKTINLPEHATVQEIDHLYRQAHTLGIKCLSVYRDNSKLSQPLTTSPRTTTRTLEHTMPPTVPAQPVTAPVTAEPWGSHRPLPNRRDGHTQKVVVGGHKLFIKTGEYQDGTVGEIFLDMHKEGAAFRSLMNCFAISISLGLQHGVPLERYVDSFVQTRFEPNGPVQHHDNIKNATSLMDLIFRHLAIVYLNRQDLAHLPVTAEDLRGDAVTPYQPLHDTTHTPLPVLAGGAPGTAREEAKKKGYAGNPCTECGQFTLIANGTCYRCDRCGATSGCS